MLTTGRMPLDDQCREPKRKPPAYTPEQIRLITAYVASLGNGPAIPRVDPAAGNLVSGRGSNGRTHMGSACLPREIKALLGLGDPRGDSLHARQEISRALPDHARSDKEALARKAAIRSSDWSAR